ncbi:MAG: aldehyde dehydrogenase family protein, partial [Flavobacterium stagni]
KLTAKRIVWGKFLNAGQTCIAPDYILVHASIYEPLVSALKIEIEAAYGKDPEQSPDYARIISDKHWVRLEAMSQQGTVLYGGTGQRDQRYWAPTLIAPDQNSALMQEELFGPILPLVPFTEEKEITKWIQRNEKPLAFYIFTKNIRWAKQLMHQHGFGGGCINDTILHFNNKRLPFGGVGHSGMGAYHGQWGFDTFSHRKAIVYKPFWGDVPLRYAPYLSKINFVKKIMKLF